MTSSKIGFMIPNSDLKFEIKKAYSKFNYLFLVTSTNEVLVFELADQLFSKKFILLSHPQHRENITDLFIMSLSDSLLESSNKLKNTIVTISETFIIHLWSIKSGKCISKVNLSKVFFHAIKYENSQPQDHLLLIQNIDDRFLLFLFTKRFALFDTFSQTIALNQVYLFEDKKVSIKESMVVTAYPVKSNKFFLISDLKNSYFLKVMMNKFYDSHKDNNNDPNFNYDKLEYEFYKSNFNWPATIKIYEGPNSKPFLTSSPYEAFVYADSISIKYSSLDSIEDMSILAQRPLSYAQPKNEIIFNQELELGSINCLVIVYSSFQADFIYYDKKIQEVKQLKKYNLVLETSSKPYGFLADSSKLLVYSDNLVSIFEFTEEELQSSSSNSDYGVFGKPSKDEKIADRFCDSFLDLNDCFDKKIYLTNYFKENFCNFKEGLLKELNNEYKEKCSSELEKNPKIRSDSMIEIRRNTMSRKPKQVQERQYSITNLHYFSRNSNLFSVSCSIIFVNQEDFLYYYIIGFDMGLVLIFEIFFNENFEVSPVFRIKTHTSKINFLSVYLDKVLIIGSEDGKVSFTDVSKRKLTLSKLEQTRISTKDKDINSESSKLGGFSTSPPPFNKTLSSSTEHTHSPTKLNAKLKDDKIVFIDLIHYQTYNSFNRLIRVIPVVVLDSFTVVENEHNKKKSKSNLGFVMANNSMVVINMDSFTTTCNFTSNTRQIKGVYMHSHSKLILVLLDNLWLKIVNFSTKSVDRVIKDVDTVYQMLRVEDKFKIFFKNINKVIINDFEANYIKEEKKSDYTRNQEPIDVSYYETRPKTGEVKNLKEMCVDNFGLNYFNKSITSMKKKEFNYVPAKPEYTEDTPQVEKLKQIFYSQFMHQLSFRKKIYINSTYNKFDTVWMKMVENLVIDQIFALQQNPNMDDKSKRIEIFNYISYPQPHFLNTKDRITVSGIDSSMYFMGQQSIQGLQVDYQEMFYYIERLVHELKTNHAFLKVKHNFFNILSLFRIWNLSLDQDSQMIETFKLFSPIFEFNLIVYGEDSTSTILLAEEEEVSSSQVFKNHFNFLFNTFIGADEAKRKQLKDKEMLMDKRNTVVNEQGYLVNYKNFKVSNEVSHLLNLIYFGSLISILGYEDSHNITKLISGDKMLLRSLSLQKYIKFTNLSSITKNIFELIDNLTMTSKDIIMVDYLLMKSNLEKTKLGSTNKIETLDQNWETKIDSLNKKIKEMVRYVEHVHSIQFEDISLSSDQDSSHLAYLTKDKLDSSKEKYLTEFDLLIIFILLNYNNINPGRLTDSVIEKTCQILILFIFKILKDPDQKSRYCKTIIELISKSSSTFDKIFKENSIHFVKLIIGLYTSIKIPIDLLGLFKKYDIGNCSIIKSEDNLNFMKIMIAKIIKSYSKTKINIVLKYIIEEFKSKIDLNDLDQYNYMMEIVWILFKEKNFKYIHYLPSLINLLMTTMSPHNKDTRQVCFENCKKILGGLLPVYPMITFHQNSQRLAVGASDGKVFIYDITTGSIWKNLNAHSNEISALSFDFTGNVLISYSSAESTLKFWKIGLTGFLTSIFGMKDGYYKIKKFAAPTSEIKPEERLNTIKLQLMPKNQNKVMLVREDQSTEVCSLS